MKKSRPVTSKLPRGLTLLSGWLAILAAICCTQPLYAASTEITVPVSPDILKGEELTFDISFWLFKNAARSRMTFIKTGDTYVATMEAQTSGFIGFVTRNMHERMTSTMRWLILLPAGPGALLGGYLGEHLGLRYAMGLGGAGALLMATWAWRHPGIWRVRSLPTTAIAQA